MSEHRAILGASMAVGGVAFFALPLIPVDSSSPGIDRVQFENLGYHVERPSAGEHLRMDYGATTVLWLEGCRIEAEWVLGRDSRNPSTSSSRWEIKEPKRTDWKGRPLELISAHQLRMHLKGHPCLNEKTPRHIVRPLGSRDPS